MIFVGGSAFCQHSTDKPSDIPDYYNIKDCFRTDQIFSLYKPADKQRFKKPIQALPGKKLPYRLNSLSPSIIEADFYTRNFGFFCKRELQLEKATKVPLRFRLGSVSYNDYLEGKPNAGIVPNY
ncbi:MAG: hypothetical protein WAU23_03860 [Ferruginibacter sp.]